MVLRLNLPTSYARWYGWRVQDGRQVDAFGLPVRVCNCGVDLVHAADHFVDSAEAKLSHMLSHLFGEEEEEVDHMLWLAGEAGTQYGVLRCDTHRTGVQVALAHHDA